MEPLIASAGINSSSLLASSEESALNNTSKTDKFVTFMTEIRCFQEIVTKLKDMRVDTSEYTCLKAIVLFKTGEHLNNNSLSLLYINSYSFV